MSFKEFKENAKPEKMDRANMAQTKQAFCIVGEPQEHHSSFQGTPQLQFLADIIYLDESGRRQSTNVFLPGSKFFQNFMEGLKTNPEYKHNLYLCMDGKAYDIDQYSGQCPCKHGTNGNKDVSRETQAAKEPDHYTPDGEPVFRTIDGEPLNLNTAPGSITAKQSRAILTLSMSLKKEPPDDDMLESFSEAQADKYILKLRQAQASPF